MPTTVPVPLPVVVVRVDGPFTALDRKLWVALLRHAHSNLVAGHKGNPAAVEKKAARADATD
jgi:hypothetical protein